MRGAIGRLGAGLAVALLAQGAGAQTAPADPTEASFRSLYRELVETNTTRSVGSCTQAAEVMRKRLVAAGIPETDTKIWTPADRPKDGKTVGPRRSRGRRADET